MTLLTWRNIGYFLLSLGLLWLLLIGGVYLFQKFIIFQGKPLPKDHVFEFQGSFKEFNLTTSEGHQLNAVYFNTPHPRQGAVLYFHGNAGNLQRWGQYHHDLTRRGYDVLMIDYRGYGKSEGEPSTEAFYRDGRMAYEWLKKKFSPQVITIYGRSLGSSVASQLASKVEARQLILETPFDNIRHSLELTIPTLWLPWPLRYPFANDRYLADVKYPVHIFHGTQDRIVSYQSAQGLLPFLKKQDVFYTIPEGEHKDLAKYPTFQQGLDKILRKPY